MADATTTPATVDPQPHGARGTHGRLRGRRPLALSSVVATGVLTGSVVGMPTADAHQTNPVELPHRALPWDAHRAVGGELAGMASSAPQLLDLVGGGDEVDGSVLRTVELIERVAWTRQVAAGGSLASLDATLVRGRHRSASNSVLATRLARTVAPGRSSAEWRGQDQRDHDVALADLAAAEAARAEAERIAAEQAAAAEAARVEAERIAAEQAEAARVAAEQAEAARVEAERIESERIAAEQAAQEVEAQRWQPEPQAQPGGAAAPAPAAPAQPAPAPAPVAPAAAPAATNDTEAMENQAFALINAERAALGLPALSFDASLRDSARAQAGRIAAAGSLFHQNLQPLLGQGWRTAGENVGGGPSVAALHPAFMNSPGHYANIVNPAFTSMGVGVVVSNGTVWIAYVFAG
ncbi:MAG: CAP domain-containing protein [Acidimicrobiia bacterium]